MLLACVLIVCEMCIRDSPDTDFVLMQDEAACHKGRSVVNFMGEINVSFLPWSGSRPGENPTAYIWTIVKKIFFK